jgi:hypothetical protein
MNKPTISSGQIMMQLLLSTRIMIDEKISLRMEKRKVGHEEGLICPCQKSIYYVLVLSSNSHVLSISSLATYVTNGLRLNLFS